LSFEQHKFLCSKWRREIETQATHHGKVRQTSIGVEQIKNYENIVKQVEQNQQPKDKTNGKD